MWNKYGPILSVEKKQASETWIKQANVATIMGLL